jgi:hypothetical protein
MSVHSVLMLGTLVAAAPAFAESPWNRAAAAHYLDARASEWTAFSRARQKLSTACISCHTAMPYLLASPALGALPEAARVLFSDVKARVDGWKDARVWYEATRGPEKPEQSRDTESVLNALVLALRDSAAGVPPTEETKEALRLMWKQQNEDGSWSWLHFGLGPWETDGSEYWGASLAAVAAMSAGEAVPPEASEKLRSFLRAGLSRETSSHNRLSLLWAASAWKGLLTPEEKRSLTEEVLSAQQPDGGFRLLDLGPWPPKDGSAPSQASDGYATAFTTYVLQRLDDPRDRGPIERALSWLRSNQKEDGRWETLSPNKDRSGEVPMTRLLASDAATAFAVLALRGAEGRETDTPQPDQLVH